MPIVKRILSFSTLITLLSLNISYASDTIKPNEEKKTEQATQITSQDEPVKSKPLANYDKEEVKKTIDNASLDAQKNAQDAQKSLIEANEIAKKATSEHLTKLAKNKADIEKSRKEIAKLQIFLTNDLKKTNQDLDKISEALKKIEDKYSQKHLSRHSLEITYQEVVSYWRTLADNSLKVFSQKTDLKIEKYNPDDLFHKIPKEIADQDLIEQRNKSYQLLQTEYSNILNLKRDLKIANKNYQSDLLLKSSELRANILQKILSLDKNYITYNNQYAQDLVRELKLIPYQPIFVFYSKIQQYKQTIGHGLTGLLYIMKQLGLLTLLIIIILVSKKTLAKLTNLFNLLNQFCIKKSISDRNYVSPAIFLSKTAPYFKWLMLIGIFFLANTVIENTLFSELGVLIPYFQYYFLYKIFRIFAHNILTNLSYKITPDDSKKRQIVNEKIRKTTKILGFYLLSSVYTVHLTKTIVNKAYFYDLTFNIFGIGLIIVLAIVTSHWREEIRILSKNKLSKRLHRSIDKLLINIKRAILFSFIILSLLIVREILFISIKLLGNYDFFKNLLSQIYRKKLESAAKMVDQEDEVDISNTYIKSFSKVSKSDNFIPIRNHPSEEFKAIIDNWQSGKSEENSIAIHSEKGIGKSKFIEKITQDNGEFRILQTKIDRKITDKDELLQIVCELFNKKASEKTLFKFLSQYKHKTIIIIDDCHNLFLAKEDGFEALKLFFNLLVKIDNPNLLWIATFNSYSWTYLKHSLKINNYFRYILRLPRWSDENIRELIIERHKKTNFKLIYDPLIFAINTNKSEKEFEDLQQKFFQIIWSQSRGNPTIAMSLWLSSLKKEDAKSVKISLPKIAKSSQLNTLDDEHLFVYGAIVKHQNLSITEIASILSISPEEVLNIIRIGLEKGYLTQIMRTDKKRYTTSSEWQTAINQLLINRNFIYAE